MAVTMTEKQATERFGRVVVIAPTYRQAHYFIKANGLPQDTFAISNSTGPERFAGLGKIRESYVVQAHKVNSELLDALAEYRVAV